MVITGELEEITGTSHGLKKSSIGTNHWLVGGLVAINLA